MNHLRWAAAAAGGLLALLVLGASAQQAAEAPLGALTPENFAKQKRAPLDITGTWQHELRGPQSWKFVPEKFELTPEAQKHYDAGEKALAEGKVYRDDIGQCWPAGMPLIMTRVWPIAVIQVPTAIYMISGFMNSLRIIYLDGRQHSDPEIVVPSSTRVRYSFAWPSTKASPIRKVIENQRRSPCTSPRSARNTPIWQVTEDATRITVNVSA